MASHPAVSLTVLGSGTAVPSLIRCSAGYLLRTPGFAALVDCGNGVLRQLLRTEQPYAELDAVFVTHTHADHVAALVPLLHALNLLPPPRVQPLHLFGPPGFVGFVEDRVLPVSSSPISYEVRAVEAGQSTHFRDATVTTAPTVHTQSTASVAYRFEINGRSIVLSGDADADSDLVRLALDANLLILDCSFPNALKTPGHLCAGECGRLAHEARVRTVVLSHLYPTSLPDSVRVEECREHFAGEIILAEDLLRLRL